ncbi:HigA family addiction module antidote protein [Allochromatium humboldtianum]|jgi:antitoxin HigA-1|uniref:HigA family addiction module antidote protein n=1 Tax=Allochromatium humboldtianum TaxID=504901 RepID=A0A850RC34_9GAMM|nr:HigA family addiction module antitoxin [Allochromatium humboldtianum]NVZ08817.1 HigA family addiction module antidote protein [Allochromatium humboldtianum]
MSLTVESLHECDFSDVAEGDLSPVPPGEILAHEFLEPLAITPYRLAKSIGVPQQRLGEILAGRRSVTADTGLRLSRFFGTSDGFWIGLQADYDMAKARASMGDALDRITPFRRAA